MPFASPRSSDVRWFATLLVLGGCIALLSRLIGPRRFLVSDRSMEPTVVDGQGLIGVRLGSARVGQLRTFEHPDRPDFWLVKRVTAVRGDSMIVESDNRDVATVDSNTFGPVDVAGSYRVVFCVPVRWM